MNINEIVGEVLWLNREATPGPWYEQSGDDDWHMGSTYVGTADGLDTSTMANGCEANDVVAITLLQHPRLANVRDGRWNENAALIAHYRTAAPALAREVRRLQIILEACDERSQMCLEAVEEADEELRAALDEIDRLRACALPSEGAYISGRVDGERIGFRAGQEAMQERAAALCRARAEVNEQRLQSGPPAERITDRVGGMADEAEACANAIRALEVGHD